jgi:hypothetical protein
MSDVIVLAAKHAEICLGITYSACFLVWVVITLMAKKCWCFCFSICFTKMPYIQINTSFVVSIRHFYLWVLHPVAYLSNWFFMTPSIATKFQYINSQHISAPPGHPQVRYTISYYLCFFVIILRELMYWNFVAIDGVIKNQLV